MISFSFVTVIINIWYKFYLAHHQKAVLGSTLDIRTDYARKYYDYDQHYHKHE